MMPTDSQSPNPNPNFVASGKTPKSSGKSKKPNHGDFEFCVVCRLNHDQGMRHKYFPNHKRALTNYLARFKSKLADVRFFLKNPTVLRPEHASRNRFWCIFCDSDIEESNSSFACYNAIKHLASAEHLKNMKHFLWKHGGSMDKLDDFRVLDTDVSKWEKMCESLEKDSAACPEGTHRQTYGPSNNIQIQQNFELVENYVDNFSRSLYSIYSFGVMPLQSTTNEHQISNGKCIGTASACDLPCNGASFASVDKCESHNLSDMLKSGYSLTDGVENMNAIAPLLDSNGIGARLDGKSCYQGWVNLTQISSSSCVDVNGNVHSGGAPPWLDSSEQGRMDSNANTSMCSTAISNKHKKSKKLNPKRVGAAWAEKRKLELEMERRGDVAKSIGDADWLPNFGRVWQSGSRKESRKEFEKEKRNFSDLEARSEIPAVILPYISKRMHSNLGFGT